MTRAGLNLKGGLDNASRPLNRRDRLAERRDSLTQRVLHFGQVLRHRLHHLYRLALHHFGRPRRGLQITSRKSMKLELDQNSNKYEPLPNQAKPVKTK